MFVLDTMTSDTLYLQKTVKKNNFIPYYVESKL